MPSLTIIIPAYREEQTLEATYETTIRSLQKAGVSDYEIFIVTDNCDGTNKITRRIQRRDLHVIEVYRPENTTFGYKYREGLACARKEFVAMVPAHNLIMEESLVDLFRRAGTADSVLMFIANPQARPWKTQFVSRCYNTLCNLLFGLHVRYFNGANIHRRELLQQAPLAADNNACMAEAVIYLLKSGATYVEIPKILCQSTRTGRAFNFKSVISCSCSLARLFWRVHFLHYRVVI